MDSICMHSKCAPNKYDFRITRVARRYILALYLARLTWNAKITNTIGEQCTAPAPLGLRAFVDSVIIEMCNGKARRSFPLRFKLAGVDLGDG